MAANTILQPVLRVLQLLFAIIVMGTDGYAIHVYRGFYSYTHTPDGEFYNYNGVPSAWGFLMFCAVWTFVVAIFQFMTKQASSDRSLISYIRLAVEAVALLSWFAAWIAVAANIGTEACSKGYISCKALEVATVFGAIEWLLFMVTTAMIVLAFVHGKLPRH